MAQLTMSARNATLDDLVSILRGQAAHKLDVVAPASKIEAIGGIIQVGGVEADVTDDGVTRVDGAYQPTAIFDGDLAEKLRIPRDYLRRCREGNMFLYDANVNGWLGEDDRNFLLRLFRGEGEVGVARALLSDSYKMTMDNLDVLTAALRGIEMSGTKVDVIQCDLSETRMRVRVVAPDVSVMAPGLLEGYRSPFRADQFRRIGGHRLIEPDERPIVGIGFDLDNSETGGGAFNMRPFVDVLACTNGLVLTEHIQRKVHLGQRLDTGVIRVSKDTIQKAADLISAETRDLVATWLTPGFLQAAVSKLEQKAGVAVTKVEDVVRHVGGVHAFTEAEQDAVLAHFIAGGQLTTGGIMQAVSSVAQTIEDPERAFKFERLAVPAMETAYMSFR